MQTLSMLTCERFTELSIRRKAVYAVTGLSGGIAACAIGVTLVTRPTKLLLTLTLQSSGGVWITDFKEIHATVVKLYTIQ